MDFWDVTSAADFAKVEWNEFEIHRAIRYNSTDGFENDQYDFGIAFITLEDGNAMVTKWNREHYSNSILPIATVTGLVSEMHGVYDEAIIQLGRMVTPD